MRIILPPAAVWLVMCGTCLAHSPLLSSSPAANATVAAPQRLRLAFGERVERALTGATMKCAGTDLVVPDEPTLSPDGKVVELALPPLPKGSCAVLWHAVSVDGHRTKGEFSFTVR